MAVLVDRRRVLQRIRRSAVPAASRHAPLVSASRETESTVTIAFVNPQRPLTIETAAQALADDANRERAKRGLPALARLPRQS